MSVKYRLVAIFGLLILVIFAMAVISMYQYHRYVNESRSSQEQASKAVTLAFSAQVHFKRQVQEWKNILLRGQDEASFSKYLGYFEKEEAITRQDMKDLLAMYAADSEVALNSKSFLSAHEILGKKYRDGLTVYKASRRDPHLVTDKHVKGVDREPTELLDKIVEEINREAEQNYSDLADRQKAMDRLLGISFILVLLLLAGGGYWVMHRTILVPMYCIVHDVSNMSNEVADGRGDLTQRLNETSKDEFGELARCINVYVGSLQQIIREATGSSAQLSAAAEELAAVTEQTRNGVLKQQSETDQVAAAMNEMASTVQEVARNTAHAAGVARSADEKTRNGIDAVTQAIEMIDDLANEVRDAAKAVSKLEQDSAEIGKVVDVIRSIAEQTNLLALNAAIEAARAGEQGRGFAVVADEVRVLASRTQNSTQEIQAMIQRLQDGTKQAAQVMLRGNQQAKVCVREAGKGASMLAAISESVGTINDMSAQIASAAEEQGAVAEEINRNIVNISEIASQTASGVEQTAAATSELARLAINLQGMVSQFRL